MIDNLSSCDEQLRRNVELARKEVALGIWMPTHTVTQEQLFQESEASRGSNVSLVEP